MLDFSVQKKSGGLDLTVSGQINAGVTALLGRSGAGKTSLLRLLAGLSRPDSGHVQLGERMLFDQAGGIDVAVQKRDIGMVFQEPRLLPHLSVIENVRLGSKNDVALFEQIVGQFQLAKLFERPVGALSGGEQQRVALARAILQQPKLFLLDEPLSSLDAQSAQELLPFIETMVRAAQVPMLYVTHAIDEAARLASSGLVLEAGRLVMQGQIGDVVAHLQKSDGHSLGNGAVSVLSGVVRGYDANYGLLEIGVEGRVLEIAGRERPVGSQVRVIVWARDVILALDDVRDVSARNQLRGTLGAVVMLPGGLCDVCVQLGGQQLMTRITAKSCDEMGLLDSGSAVRDIVALVKSCALEDSI